ncbi:hypothetical protein ElyMa_002501700 [Elysia marginata]|uniref:Uncharacterized protein n=1 Tax=Elysia marginata TaxID=1093978 RepID=A0AAV4GPS6_9GAST|nr:hypothetical protein ElyMa_002501700 [Elysia marginata]
MHTIYITSRIKSTNGERSSEYIRASSTDRQILFLSSTPHMVPESWLTHSSRTMENKRESGILSVTQILDSTRTHPPPSCGSGHCTNTGAAEISKKTDRHDHVLLNL